MPAPIALFVYKRLKHTKLTVESLLKNNEASSSELYVFADGPRSENDYGAVAEVREYVKNISGFSKIHLNFKERNAGLANSVIAGVTEVLNNHESVIVVEDDLLLSEYFLNYMNSALELYRDDERVISIHGYVYPLMRTMPETFFLRGADCWGWATWRRGWNLFNPDSRFLLSELRRLNLTEDFNFHGNGVHLKMLKKQISGKIDSWAIRWHASAYINNKLTLYPGNSLVYNTGNDGLGTHTESTQNYDTELLTRPVKLGGIDVEENKIAYAAFEEYFKKIKPSVLQQVFKSIKKHIGIK